MDIRFDGNGAYTIVRKSSHEVSRQILETTAETSTASGDYGWSNTYGTTDDTEEETGISGTYTVSDTGLVTLTEAGGGEVNTCQLSADGSTLLFAQSEFESGAYWSQVELSIAIKRPQAIGAGGANLLLLGE